MKYPALTDQQIEGMRAKLQPGIYEFQVVSAEEKVSQTSGNEMIKLTLKVWDKEGRQFTVFDYLVATEKMAFKTKHFCESIGAPELYCGETDAALFTDRCGHVKTALEKEEYKGRMQEKVRVVDYVTVAKSENKPADFVDSDIPF